MPASRGSPALESPLSRCAANNTIVCTTAAPEDAHVVLPLARSAYAAGFPCVVVLPFDAAHLPKLPEDERMLHVLPSPSPSLLPRSRWCNASRKDYTHRRRQLHRMRLWRMVVDLGHNVLSTPVAGSS